MTTPRLDLSGVPVHLRDKLDAQLSRLPAGVRDKLQLQLAQLPPDQLARLLEHGSPTLDKILARAEQVRASVSPQKKSLADFKPIGHFNRTVQPGDQPGLVSKILFGLGLVAVVYYMY